MSAADPGGMKARLTPGQLKAVLNLEATRRLRRHGYSNRMADEAKRDTWMWATARGGAVARRARVVESHGIVWSRQGWAELSPPSPVPWIMRARSRSG